MKKLWNEYLCFVVYPSLIVGGTIFFVFVGVKAALYFNPHPTQQDEENVKKEYKCVPTNQFVGRYAERLYLCADGVMYKEGVFWHWAKQKLEKK